MAVYCSYNEANEGKKMEDVRKITNKLLEAMDEGTLDARHLVECCLRAMSEADVSAMAAAEELNYFDDPGEEEEGYDFMEDDYFDALADLPDECDE